MAHRERVFVRVLPDCVCQLIITRHGGELVRTQLASARHPGCLLCQIGIAKRFGDERISNNVEEMACTHGKEDVNW